jgi:ribosomal protein S18 acetylase RimI-like enzyme
MERQGMADETVTAAGAEIRRVRAGEWAAYRQVRLAALAEAPYAFSSTLEQESAKDDTFWQDRAANGIPMFIAWQDGEPAGLAGAFVVPDGELPPGVRRAWHLVSMWVSPQARGSGLAERLVQAVAGAARADGATRLILWVTEVNERARAFYGRLGFRPTGARQLVRPDEPDHWEEERSRDLQGL